MKPNIRFAGWLPDEQVRSHYARCRAFIFCGEEDFGINPLEAQAMGRPVIALARGGALETVIPDRRSWKPETEVAEEETAHPAGAFFYEKPPEALRLAVRHFETIENGFETKAIRKHALELDVDTFSDQIQHFIQERFQKHQC
ncbi:MAG: glycosyltransferase [Nitrospinaceae bacterium]